MVYYGYIVQICENIQSDVPGFTLLSVTLKGDVIRFVMNSEMLFMGQHQNTKQPPILTSIFPVSSHTPAHQLNNKPFTCPDKRNTSTNRCLVY